MRYIKLYENMTDFGFDFDVYLKILRKYIKILSTDTDKYYFAKSFFIILYNFLILERGFHDYISSDNYSIYKYLFLNNLDKIEDVFSKFERLYDPQGSMVRCNLDRLSDRTEIIKKYLKNKPDFFKKLVNYKKTMMDKYGVEYPIQNYEIKEKTKKTNLERYGVEYSAQNAEIFKKTRSSAFKLKNYKNLTYMGTYELDFIETFYDKIIIENAKSIDYMFNGKNKVYFPDYYLPDYNLIAEIKSVYTYECEKDQNEAKKEAAINNGYNFIFIIDKDYTKLLSILE